MSTYFHCSTYHTPFKTYSERHSGTTAHGKVQTYDLLLGMRLVDPLLAVRSEANILVQTLRYYYGRNSIFDRQFVYRQHDSLSEARNIDSNIDSNIDMRLSIFISLSFRYIPNCKLCFISASKYLHFYVYLRPVCAYAVISEYLSADISVMSPIKLFIFINKSVFTGSKYLKNIIYIFDTKALVVIACLRSVSIFCQLNLSSNS